MKSQNFAEKQRWKRLGHFGPFTNRDCISSISIQVRVRFLCSIECFGKTPAKNIHNMNTKAYTAVW